MCVYGLLYPNSLDPGKFIFDITVRAVHQSLSRIVLPGGFFAITHGQGKGVYRPMAFDTHPVGGNFPKNVLAFGNGASVVFHHAAFNVAI